MSSAEFISIVFDSVWYRDRWEPTPDGSGPAMRALGTDCFVTVGGRDGRNDFYSVPEGQLVRMHGDVITIPFPAAAEAR